MRRQVVVTPFARIGNGPDVRVDVRPTQPLYVPPGADEPLDDIERALVEALASIIVRDILAEQVSTDHREEPA